MRNLQAPTPLFTRVLGSLPEHPKHEDILKFDSTCYCVYYTVCAGIHNGQIGQILKKYSLEALFGFEGCNF